MSDNITRNTHFFSVSGDVSTCLTGKSTTRRRSTAGSVFGVSQSFWPLEVQPSCYFFLILIDVLEGFQSLEVVNAALINIFILTIDQEPNMKGATCSDEPSQSQLNSHVSFRHVEPVFRLGCCDNTLWPSSGEGSGTITTWWGFKADRVLAEDICSVVASASRFAITNVGSRVARGTTIPPHADTQLSSYACNVNVIRHVL